MAIPRQDNPAAAAAEDYPCVRRVRHRRLLSFLRLEGLEAAFASMAGETDACFSVSRLRRMVERGQWNDGINYLGRFLPAEFDRLGLEAQVLLRFLVAHSVLANIIAGTEKGAQAALKYSLYGKHGGPVDQGILRLRNIMLIAFHLKEQLRISLDWECVKRKASEIVDDLAHKAPELKVLGLRPMTARNDPIRLGSRWGCHRKEQFRRLRPSVLAKHYLQRRTSLLSSSHYQELHDVAELSKKTMNCVANLVDNCLKAGKRLEHPLMPSGRTGPSFPPARAGPLMYPHMLYVANAGNFASNVPSTGVPSLGTMFGVPQTVLGCLTNPDKGSGMSLMTDAGTNKQWNQEGCDAESYQQDLNL